MNAQQPAPEVIEAVASIETQRRRKERRLGVPVSCGWALRELYGLLGRGMLPANIAAATAAIEQLRKLARLTGQRAMREGKRTARLQRSWRDERSSGNRIRAR